MAASGAAAQTPPSALQPFIEEQRQQDRERALREQQERSVDVRLPTAPERTAGRLPESEVPCFRIDSLVLEGEHADDFQWLLREAAGEQSDDAPLGRCLGTQGVNTVIERLQQALIAQGWVTSRVLAAPQDLATGTLRLTLVPGRIAAIRFAEGTADRTSLRTARLANASIRSSRSLRPWAEVPW